MFRTRFQNPLVAPIRFHLLTGQETALSRRESGIVAQWKRQFLVAQQKERRSPKSHVVRAIRTEEANYESGVARRTARLSICAIRGASPRRFTNHGLLGQWPTASLSKSSRRVQISHKPPYKQDEIFYFGDSPSLAWHSVWGGEQRKFKSCITDHTMGMC